MKNFWKIFEVNFFWQQPLFHNNFSMDFFDKFDKFCDEHLFDDNFMTTIFSLF